ncbi:MAG: hypothetical protein ABI373_10835, partial [Flavobacteriales bacterium]
MLRLSPLKFISVYPRSSAVLYPPGLCDPDDPQLKAIPSPVPLRPTMDTIPTPRPKTVEAREKVVILFAG